MESGRNGTLYVCDVLTQMIHVVADGYCHSSPDFLRINPIRTHVCLAAMSQDDYSLWCTYI